MNAVETAAAGVKERTATPAELVKRAKNTLAASRVSQRAALLTKKRAAAAVKIASTPDAAEETAPETLRGAEGATALDISLDTSPPPPPSPLDLTAENTCDCTSDCEADFHEELWEDGVRLNTREPDWESVFPRISGQCCFCKRQMPDSKLGAVGECRKCAKLSTFQCVKKYAPRWRYPSH